MVADELWLLLTFIPFSLTSSWIHIISISLFVVACSVSSTLRFYIKFCLMLIYYCSWSIIYIILLLPTPGSKNNFHKISKVALRKWMERLWGFHVNVKGRENYKKDAQYIIVANHQSFLDFYAALNFVPPNTTFLAKREALFIPVLGFLLWLTGVHFINRGNHKDAMNTMKKTADQILKKKVHNDCFNKTPAN